MESTSVSTLTIVALIMLVTPSILAWYYSAIRPRIAAVKTRPAPLLK